jgi:DNA-binding Lrp family transcriptional regulator
MRAYALIKIRSGEIPEALRQLREVRGVVSVDMTFGPYDAIAVLESGDLHTLGRMVATDIQSAVGVVETWTCLVVEGV